MSDLARDVSEGRAPAWGDVTDLIELLDVRPAGEHRFASSLRPSSGRSIVEASQLLGQSIVAACRVVPARRVVSASMVFNRVVHDSLPFGLELERLSSGRTFSSFAVHVVQRERRCATGVVLLGVTSPDVVRHAIDAPAVAGPADAVPVDMGVTGRELRIVDDAYSNRSDAAVGPPVIDAWMRYREVPEDQPIHAALLAQFTGHMSIAAALRPHGGIGQDQAHRTISTAPMAINLALHAEVRADEWMLFHHESTSASDGMTHSDCRVHDLHGGLIASFSVDAMVRPFASTGAVDTRAAL